MAVTGIEERRVYEVAEVSKMAVSMAVTGIEERRVYEVAEMRPIKRCPAVEVSQVTCTRIWQQSMSVRVEYRDEMGLSPRFPSLLCRTTISPIPFPISLATSPRVRSTWTGSCTTDRSTRPSTCFPHCLG